MAAALHLDRGLEGRGSSATGAAIRRTWLRTAPHSRQRPLGEPLCGLESPTADRAAAAGEAGGQGRRLPRRSRSKSRDGNAR